MSEEQNDDPLAWVGDIDTDQGQSLPDWAVENGFERTGRTCTRCHGEILERRKVAYTGMNDSFIMVRCENYNQGCQFQNEISPGYDDT